MSSETSGDIGESEKGKERPRSEGQPEADHPVRGVVRLQKTILFDEAIANRFDESVINPRFYDRFNYSLLPGDRPRGRITLGITSPHSGDGKTLVAANLAVSLALSTESEVLLVDLNVQRPIIHRLFSISRKPGLLESLDDTTIRVRRTRIHNLAVLPLGDVGANALQGIRLSVGNERKRTETTGSAINLEHLPEFRNVLYSLEQRFDLIVVDLPSMEESALPTLFMRQLNGVVVVVNAGRTKKEDLDKLFKKLDLNQVVGFVFNRARTDQVV